MNKAVDNYLDHGCMRCEFGGTPRCKVHPWREELETLRQVVLETGLTEEVKWGVPCYTADGKNIVMVSAFKEYACLSFFKGVLLKDKEKILLKPGERSQSARIIKFTNTKKIKEQAVTLKSYIAEAVALEHSGKKVEFAKNPEPVPVELLEAFKKDLILKNAFYNLTPGRQRGYIIYISQPKQSSSRVSRIEKCRTKILNNEGLHDKYSR